MMSVLNNKECQVNSSIDSVVGLARLDWARTCGFAGQGAAAGLVSVSQLSLLILGKHRI